MIKKNSEETQNLLLEIKKVENKHAEVVNFAPFELMYEDQNDLDEIKSQIEKLTKLVKMEKHSLGELVQQKTKELTKTLENLEEKINDVSKDVKSLLIKNKTKHTPLPLRDPITEEIFQLVVFNAGSTASYEKDIRKAQLKIAYTLLYHIGLRLNELRMLSPKDVEQAIKRSELPIILFKTNRPHNYPLSSSAVKDLQNLKKELDLLLKTHKFEYLFGKKVPPNPKTLLRIVNHDLKNTCNLCQISDNITSHSFRVSVISRLLRVTTVQNVKDIMGHQDIRSTMKYDRYRLTKAAIQNIHLEAEKVTDFIKIENYSG